MTHYTEGHLQKCEWRVLEIFLEGSDSEFDSLSDLEFVLQDSPYNALVDSVSSLIAKLGNVGKRRDVLYQRMQEQGRTCDVCRKEYLKHLIGTYTKYRTLELSDEVLEEAMGAIFLGLEGKEATPEEIKNGAKTFKEDMERDRREGGNIQGLDFLKILEET
jgi:hypothetical protein